MLSPRNGETAINFVDGEKNNTFKLLKLKIKAQAISGAKTNQQIKQQHPTKTKMVGVQILSQIKVTVGLNRTLQ